jgi:hypothetical protein
MASPPIALDKLNRAVVAYRNGKRLKGHLLNFSPLKDRFRLFSGEPGKQQPGIDVSFVELKAIFFVKDFEGDASHIETSTAEPPKNRRKLVVTFGDGEELMGTTEAYNAQKLGFFMYPLDVKSNNLRIFVINKNVRNVKMF